MNVEQIRELFPYNAGANRRIFDALAALPVEDYMRDLKCSFASIHGTMAHIVGAERLWLSRWRGETGVTLQKGSDFGSLADVRKVWDQVEADRWQYLARLTPSQIESEITFRPTAGGEFTHRLIETLLHTVDHSTYHRGQIVTML